VPRGQPAGRYQILAAINAVHTDAPTAPDTDWSPVVALYDQLTRLDPSPIVALDRAVAVAELDGPHVALALVDRMPLTVWAPSAGGAPTGCSSPANGIWRLFLPITPRPTTHLGRIARWANGPPEPRSDVTDLAADKVRRRPILGGLTNEYSPAG
jgi:hypothetical protein